MPETLAPASPGRVLTINGGSSSIKFALFTPGERLRRVRAGVIERIGLPDTVLRIPDAPPRVLAAPDHAAAIAGLLDFLDEAGELAGIVAVGHRIVHGGPAHTADEFVTPHLLADLRAAVPFDPIHLPAEIRLVEVVSARLPGLPQVACFDTAFHRDLPPVAQRLPIPRYYADAGLRRYGFHGLSYAYLLEELERLAGSEVAHGRVIFAHLGSGASLAAVRGGKSVDTTMGLTPAGGLVMSTRTGELDPGVLVHLARTEGLTADQLDELVTRKSGLLGVSETSPDVRDLLARQATDPRAAEAIELFCYQGRKWIGALAAALGGVDTLVFSGGIGEHAAEIRARMCDGLAFLGIGLDPAANAVDAPKISAAGSVAVRVIPTDEEVMIARTVLRMIGSPQEQAS